MNQIVGFEIGILIDLINKAAVIKQTQKINSEYFNQKKRTAPQGTIRGDNHIMPIRKDLTNQHGGVIRLSNHIAKEGVSNAHRARSVVGCILGIASTGNQATSSTGNLDILQVIVRILLTTKPTRIAQRDKEPQRLLECML